MTYAILYTLRMLCSRQCIALTALVVFCTLTAASVLHPILHDHCCEPEECLVAQCLTAPQITPEIVTVQVVMAVVSRTEVAPVFPCPQGMHVAAASRGPPAFTTG